MEEVFRKMIDKINALPVREKEMFQESTTFIITQRLSTVRNADRIIVLNHGQIAEIGTHQNLVDKPNGIYSKLYHTLKVEERASWD